MPRINLNQANTNNPNSYFANPTETAPISDIMARMLYGQRGYTGSNGGFLTPNGELVWDEPGFNPTQPAPTNPGEPSWPSSNPANRGPGGLTGQGAPTAPPWTGPPPIDPANGPGVDSVPGPFDYNPLSRNGAGLSGRTPPPANFSNLAKPKLQVPTNGTAGATPVLTTPAPYTPQTVVGTNPVNRPTGGLTGGQPQTANPYQPTPTAGQQPDWNALFNSRFGGNQSSNEGRSTNQTGLDPRLDAMYMQALQAAFARFSDPSGMTYYDGPTVAGLSPEELKAQQMSLGAADQMGLHSMDGMNYLAALLQRAQNPGDDPTLNSAVGTTLAGMDRSATDTGGVFSSIRGNSLAGGSYGGTRQGVAEGVASSRLTADKAAIEAQMRLAGRTENLTAAQNGINSIPNLTTMALNPSMIYSAVGNQNRDMQQRQMDDALRRWAYNTAAPDARLDQLFSRLGASPLGQYSTGQQFIAPGVLQQNQGTSTAQNVAGGVVGGIGLYQLLNSLGLFSGS